MSKKNRKPWRASAQREAAAPEPQASAEIPPHRLRGLARVQWIEQQAQEMYRRQVGDTIDLAVRACGHTLAAFDSQMLATKGEGKAWGPDVSPYENRMNGSLIARLLREKRTWLREFRQELELALQAEAALEDAENEPEAAAERPSQGSALGRVEGPESEATRAVAGPSTEVPVGST